MNFDLSDDQRAIKRTANEFLASRYKAETMRELAEGQRGFTDEQWRELSELGWPGVMIPEDDGGLGLGAVELLVIQEEMGYALAPSPLFSTVSAALLLVAAGTDEQRRHWLEQLAGGEARGAVAVWDERSGWAPNRSEIEAENGTLSATKVAVPDAATADFLILSGADGAHYLVETASPGVNITPTKPLDPTRKLFTVQLEGAPAEPLTAGRSEQVAQAYATIVTALAAENVGVAQRTMEMAVAYAKDRKQFDRPIGSYQAVSHRCAQMLLEVEGARSLSYWAGWALDHEPSTAHRAASMAKAYAGDAGFRVAASALQVHGGIGFTWEHDLHFFLKRAKANAHAFGDSRWHRDRVAELAGVTAASALAGSAAPGTPAPSPAPTG
ncbi:MAG TPA: acyl-CoA dehydrogenase family protein [Solirubrobacteraceae bacterium]